MEKTKIKIGIIVFMTALFLYGCSPELRKITRTHNAKTKTECNEKKGYWYENKCWANFNETDEGILPGQIDSVVAARLGVAKNTMIRFDGKEHHIINALPVPQGNKMILIAVFDKNDTTNTIAVILKKSAMLFGKKKINAKAVVFDADVLNSISQPNIVAKGKVLVEILDKNSFKAHVSGVLLSGAHKVPVDYMLSEDIAGIGSSTLEIKNGEAYLNGNLGTLTYRQIKDLISEHPEVKTIVFEDVPGSINDAVNMHTGRLIHQAGLTIKVPYYGEIASGGVDLFCAGKNRIIEKGAKLGIHSWSGGSFDADDLPKDHPAHQYQIAYFTMCLGEKGKDFYFHTLEVAHAKDIHWMSESEVQEWGIATETTKRTSPAAYPDMPDIAGYYFGNPASETVIVNAQGGPETTLFTKEFKEIFIKYGKLCPDSVFAVNIQQVQTLNPDKFKKSDISFEQAVEYGKQNTKMLADAVDYFKAKGKKVVVVGISYGAFLVEDYLAGYGNVADSYFISVGRLNMPEKIWVPFSEGKMIGFKDGVEYTKIMKPKDAEQRNMSKLAAAFGHKRYMDLLKNTKMSNVVYAYGAKDEQVGRLSEAELEFLKHKKVKILKGEEGHTETIFDYLEKGFKLLGAK